MAGGALRSFIFERRCGNIDMIEDACKPHKY